MAGIDIDSNIYAPTLFYSMLTHREEVPVAVQNWGSALKWSLDSACSQLAAYKTLPNCPPCMSLWSEHYWREHIQWDPSAKLTLETFELRHFNDPE
jgi:hypothetical protein